MKLMPLGDYYAWYCEWCDTRNQTLWTRFETGQATCGACHQRYPFSGEASAVVEQKFSQVI